MCGGAQYLKEILFKVKEIVLSVNFSLFSHTVVILTIFMIVHIKYVKQALTEGSRHKTVDAPGLRRILWARAHFVLSSIRPYSGSSVETCTNNISCSSECLLNVQINTVDLSVFKG